MEDKKEEIPSPVNVPSGCSFHTRCAFKQKICMEVDPEMHSPHFFYFSSDLRPLFLMNTGGNGESIPACHTVYPVFFAMSKGVPIY